MKPGKTVPILSGFYPDPSICRVGSDYYLVNSTFAYSPGIPVFHSKDLVNWELIGHVMDRVEQMDLDGFESDKDKYSFSYSFSPGQWAVLKEGLDGTYLSTKAAGGFVGSVYAIYATSLGRPSSSTASFDWFEYEGKDARE